MSEIIECIHEQRSFFQSNQTKPVEFRREQLKKLSSLIKENEKNILLALKRDLEKPTMEAIGTEVGFILHDIEHSLKNLEKWAAPQSASTNLMNQPGKSYVLREPYGVNLVISPWNYPFQLAMAPAIAALAAGNTVILKPSELTPHTSEIMQEMINENFDSNTFHVFTGGVETSQALLAQRFDKIFFTGSTQVGKIVARAAAEYLTPATLELGGKSPALILEDCNIKVSARRILWGKTVNAGQTCVAPDYVLLPESLKEKFVQEIEKAYKEFFPEGTKLGDNYTKIVSDRHYSRLKNFLNDGKVLFGGQCDDESRKIEPTLLGNVNWDSPVMQEEIFGPILPILTYENLDEAIQKIKANEKPLAFYVFTGSSNEKERILTEISFGGGTVNDTLMHLGNPELPFGGVGQSGYGAYHGERGFLEFSHEKAVLEKGTWLDPSLRYPPYTESKLNWIRKLLG